jgi:hypothetical protein
MTEKTRKVSPGYTPSLYNWQGRFSRSLGQKKNFLGYALNFLA